ncbi:hypothetical protein CKO28_01265 [Rhodovibrio sodomensis]|uniref:Uncharacterized protein n=1 Tax=Rhodovibrio sodomensis TaxID=1088 RepID=A0ABS1D8B7_9PROT|nr:hypothetical protein [Rhodovibrio sodomensis]MBK1666673.1 hypothetical protein [Rhodovibrio sodomensis]
MSDIDFLPGRKAARTMARRLSAALNEQHGLKLRHTQAIDLLAASLGYRNRHELASAQRSSAVSPSAPSATPGANHAPNGDQAGLNPQQRLAVAQYAGGEFAHTSSVEEAEQIGDPLFHHVLVELADAGTDHEAVRILQEDVVRIEELLEAMHAQGPVDPAGPYRGDLSSFQQVVADQWLDGRYRTLHSLEGVTATGDRLLRFLVVEVADQEDCETWQEAISRVSRTDEELSDLARVFQDRADSGRVPRSARSPEPAPHSEPAKGSPAARAARPAAVDEAVASDLHDAPMAVARYLSSPPSFHTGALPMKVFVAETIRTYEARGYAFEGPDGTASQMGGVKLPDGIAFDGVIELRTSHDDWGIAEAEMEAAMEAEGYTPYSD